MNVNKKPINEPTYCFYSKLLQKPFESVPALKAAEAEYMAKVKAKEDKAATKKADATKVEDAFKALNAARKNFKERLSAVTEDYRDSLNKLKAAFEHDKNAIHADLAKAETAYADALKEFTEKYPEGYHITLKDGDFETTIQGHSSVAGQNAAKAAADLIDMLFRI